MKNEVKSGDILYNMAIGKIIWNSVNSGLFLIPFIAKPEVS